VSTSGDNLPGPALERLNVTRACIEALLARSDDAQRRFFTRVSTGERIGTMHRVTRTFTTFILGFAFVTSACAESIMYRMPDGRLLLTNFLHADGVPAGESARRMAPEPTPAESATATTASSPALVTPEPVAMAATAYGATAAPQEAKVEIVDWTNHPSSSGTFRQVEGMVRNIGLTPATAVQIKVKALDANGGLISLHDIYSDPATLVPGNEGTFQVMVPESAEIQRFSLEVRWE
jgi:hypothetical protein